MSDSGLQFLSHISATTIVFYLLAAITVGSALAVALSRNILHSAFALLGTLAGVAGLYFMLGADFVGVVQLIVYVGGILVLILFAVLLTREITHIKLSNLSVSLLAGLPAALITLALVLQVSLRAPFPKAVSAAAPTVHRIGDSLLREYLLPFEVASVVLLVALVGAMVIARRAVKEESSESPENPGGDPGGFTPPGGTAVKAVPGNEARP